jgi:hypothetical protein
VDVADGQELLLSRGHPGVAGGGEALRAVAIPTRNGELSITCLGLTRFAGGGTSTV